MIVAGLVWLVLMAWLGNLPSAERRAVLPDLGSTSTQESVHAGDTRYGSIYRDGERVGLAAVSLRPEGDGFRLEQSTALDVVVLEEPQRVESSLSARLASDYSIRSISSVLRSSSARFALRGERVVDGFRYTAELGGDPLAGVIPVDGPLYLPAGARAFVARHLDVGVEFTFAAFDPLSMGTTELRLAVVGADAQPGAEPSSWLLRESYRGLENGVRIDGAGHTLRESGPMGLRIVFDDRSLEDMGAADWKPLDVVAATAVATGPVADPRSRRVLRLRVQLPHGSRLPETDAQRTRGEVLEIRRLEPEALGSYILGEAGREWAEYLAPEPLLPSEHPRLRALAREVVGQERDALAATRAVVDWVYSYLRKTPTLSVPDALAVLDSGQGDCNEHAVLFAALARAAGIPARIVAGLVYVDGRFVYHAWNEVRAAQGWLPVDAALGQMPADATHVALAIGELWAQAELLAMVGRVELTIVESPVQHNE